MSHSQRSHSVLSPSSASRWLDCTGSLKFAAVRNNASSTTAEEGTAAHEELEQCLRNNRKSDNEYINTHLDFLESLRGQSTDYIELIEHKLDLSFLVNGTRGTADYVMLDKTKNHLYVVDFKYGMYQVNAYENEQLLLYALGAYKELGGEHEIDHVTVVISQPRISNLSIYEMTTQELLTWADVNIKPVLTELQHGNFTFNPSEKNCQYCTGNGECAAYLSQFIIPPLNTSDTLSDEELIKFAEAIDKMSKVADNIKRRLTERLIDGESIEGVRLVNGRGRRVLLPSIYEAAKQKGVTIVREQLLPITDIEKMIGRKEFAAHTVYQEGKPTLQFGNTDNTTNTTNTF